jgi:hypothetical protein
MDLALKILHLDSNHPLLWDQLQQAGFQNEADFTSSKQEIEAKIENYQGIVIRSIVFRQSHKFEIYCASWCRFRKHRL